jgi:MFS family permease
MKNNLPKLQKIVNLLIQGVIFTATYIFIYKQVFQKSDLPGLLNLLEADIAKPGFQLQMIAILGLMVVNWSLETLKWKLLIGKIEQVDFFKALQAVLTGVSISSFTPNRVGEFFGRVFVLKKASHIEGILITIVGSISQLLITILAGSVALLLFIPSYLPQASYSHGYLYYGIIAIVGILDVLLLGLFFNISILSALKERILQNGLKKIQRFFRVFAFYPNRELAVVLLLSLTRYIVFSTQFYLLLRVFDVSIPYFNALVLISLVYFIMAVIPTIALTELGIRGSVALYFFGLYLGHYPATGTIVNMGVFAASTILWMINLGIPALIGSIFVFRLQFFRKNDTSPTLSP